MLMEVSILCSRPQDAQKLTRLLKDSSSLSYTYKDFNELWEHSQEKLSQLYILDVEVVSGHERGIIDHPKYQKGLMNVVFYYSQDSLPLMASQYRMKSLGDFDIDDPDLAQRLSQVVAELKARQERQGEVGKLKADLYQARKSLDKLVEKNQREAQESDYRRLLCGLVDAINEECRVHDFLESFGRVMERANFIEEYAVLELTPNGQKLISPRLKGQKYRSFPSLWLGIQDQESVTGIQKYAQGMAGQVALDCLGDQIVTLGLQLHPGGSPQNLIYLKTTPDVREHMDWSLLESFLSGCYGRWLFLQQDRSETMGSHWVSEWEFYDLLTATGEVESVPSHLLVLEFHKLVWARAQKGHDDFQWKRFFNEFSSQVDKRVRHDYFATSLGPWGMAFFVSEGDRRVLEQSLLDVGQKFFYWRFFDDPDSILTLNLAPRLRSLKAHRDSFFSYLRQKNKEHAQQLSSSLQPEPQQDPPGLETKQAVFQAGP